MGLTAKVKQEYDLRGSLPRPLVYIQMGLLGAFFRGHAGDFNDCGVELVVGGVPPEKKKQRPLNGALVLTMLLLQRSRRQANGGFRPFR